MKELIVRIAGPDPDIDDALRERGIRTLRIERKRHGRVTEHGWEIS